MFETRKKLLAVLLQYIDELETIVATAETDYNDASVEHAVHSGDLSFDEGYLAKEEDRVLSIYDFIQDTKCELDILYRFSDEMFGNASKEVNENEH